MSAETQILDQIKTDLAFISSTNGYTNNLSKVLEGYTPLSAENDFDCAYFFMGDRKPVRNYNDNEPAQWEAALWIVIQLKSTEGNLSRAIESWVEDFRKWLWQGTGITTNKWYTLDTSLSSIVPYGGKELQIIAPNSLWDKHCSELTFKININYEIN